MTTAELGRIVLVRVPETTHGSGTTSPAGVAPAIVTAVNDDDTVNVRVFLDGDQTPRHVSVPVREGSPAAADPDHPVVAYLGDPDDDEDLDDDGYADTGYADTDADAAATEPGHALGPALPAAPPNTTGTLGAPERASAAERASAERAPAAKRTPAAKRAAVRRN